MVYKNTLAKEKIITFADVAELVYACVSEAHAARLEGSSPSICTISLKLLHQHLFVIIFTQET